MTTLVLEILAAAAEDDASLVARAWQTGDVRAPPGAGQALRRPEDEVIG